MAASLTDRISLLTRIMSDPRCTRADLAVAFVLVCVRYNSGTGRCDPSGSSIAKDAGTTQRNAIKAVRHLTKLGYLEVKFGAGTTGKYGSTNSYLPKFDFENTKTPHVTQDTPCRIEHGVEGLSHAPSDVAQGQNGLSQATPKPVREPVRLSSPQRAEEEEIARQFEAFWQAYPSRRPHPNPRKPALLKFAAAIKCGVDPAVIIAGAGRYSAYVKRQIKETNFIRQAVTWLRNDGWTDSYEPEERRLGVELADRSDRAKLNGHGSHLPPGEYDAYAAELAQWRWYVQHFIDTDGKEWMDDLKGPPPTQPNTFVPVEVLREFRREFKDRGWKMPALAIYERNAAKA